MRIAVLDGSPERGELSRRLDELAALLRERGHDVKLLALRALDIAYCTGCWSCWWKTPGECASRDDSAKVCAAVVNSDFALLASPVVMGFVSALLKKVQDKLIPLVHPYSELVRGESRHRSRYDRYPVFGLLLDAGGDADDEDVRIAAKMESHFALNMRTYLAFARLATRSARELADEIDGIQRLAAR